MTDNATPLEKLLVSAEDIGETTFELFKLQAIDKSAEVVSSLVLRVTILLVVALSVLIINIGFAMLIGTLLGNSYYGFFAIGGFYAIIAILLHYFGKNWIKTPVSNSIIIKMLQLKDR